MRSRRKLGMTMAVTAAALLAAPTAASAVAVYVDSGGVHRGKVATSTWQSITTSDVSCDGRGVYSEYYRSGNYQTIYANGGCGTSAGSGSSSNLISQANVCLDVPWSSDPCSSWMYR